MCLHVVLGVMILWALPIWGASPDRPFQWVDDENFKPLIYRNRAGKPEGIFYDILTEAFRRMHVPLQNRLYPWSRTQKMVEEGKADGMVTVYTESRRKFLKATDPILTVQERVFVSRNNPKLKEILNIRTVDGLKRFVLAETMDSGWSKEHLKGMRIIWVPTAESALNMVASGRADIYLMSHITGPDFVRDQIRKGGPLQDELQKIVMGTYPFAKMEYRLLIRKDSPYATIIDQFNETLRRMHSDGTFEKIMKRYRSDMALGSDETSDPEKEVSDEPASNQ